MPLYHYKTADSSGKITEGEVEAKDKFALYHMINKEGGAVVVSTKEIKKKGGLSFSMAIPFLSGVKTHDKIMFARNLSKMIDAGLPITRGLSIIERETKKGVFKDILKGLSESIAKGVTLSEGMKVYPKVFSTLFVSMTAAGEESGNLSVALQNVSSQLEKSYQMTRKIQGALIYPAVILCLMVAIGVLMMIYMVPTLTATFVSLKISLPLSTRIIIGISDFLKNYIIFALLGTFVFIFGITFFFRTARGQRIYDFIILHIPVVGPIVKQVNSARTARTLSSLISSGVDILVAINVTKDVIQNSYYKEALEKIQTVIQKGDQMSSVFLAHEKLYPLFVGEMVSVGEETGKIGEMFHSVASFYEEEVDQKTKDMSSVIEPFLMIFIGLAVGFFAISMISPIYSIGDGIN
jgi:type IV pilus assembly protein PilC